ncbi:hypothetical protein L484_022661 [Morus notabilis]|uniref:Uncharacterized protein n=1 Tax=Morus notabilis TaxID=981085 RepID=W9R850_9ROSA|nr:hypothetical protein L484_022661 [Morus notabilis]
MEELMETEGYFSETQFSNLEASKEKNLWYNSEKLALRIRDIDPSSYGFNYDKEESKSLLFQYSNSNN